MPADAPGRLAGWAGGLGLLLVWVAFHLVSRLSTQQSLTAWDVGALRYAGAFAVVLPIALWRARHGVPLLPPLGAGRLAVILTGAGFVFPLGAFAGFQLAPAAHGAVVMAAGLPVLTALFGVALGQTRIGPRRATSLALVVLGSVLLAAASAGIWVGAWRGDLLFLLAIAGWATYTVAVPRWRLGAFDAMQAIGLLAAPLYLPVWWLALPSTIAAAPAGAVLGQMVFQGVFASVLAGWLFTRTVRALGPGPTSMIGAAVPGLAALIAWPLLGEAVPTLGFVAIGIVTMGMLLGMARG